MTKASGSKTDAVPQRWAGSCDEVNAFSPTMPRQFQDGGKEFAGKKNS
jgi:hypothetical protein